MKGVLYALGSIVLLQRTDTWNDYDAFESRTYFYAGGQVAPACIEIRH